jgi:DNA-binding transcriptional MerR regulator
MPGHARLCRLLTQGGSRTATNTVSWGSMSEIMAFSTDQVARLTGLSERQVRLWARTEFFLPEFRDESRRPFGRIYSFRDVVGLRALARMRKQHGVSLQELRHVGAWLGERFRDPWATLTFYVANRRVFIDDPDTGAITQARSNGQTALPFEMAEIARETRDEIDRLRHRGPEVIGKIERNRYLAHNAWVLAGTRIPTSAIWDFHDAGYGVDAIVAEYPRLTPADVAAAIDFEKRQRAS